MEKNQKNLSKRFVLDGGVSNLAKKFAKKFKAGEIYLVGGAVRDIILGRPVKDIDLLARKVKLNDLEKFLTKEGKVSLVGKRFGVLKFLPKNLPSLPLIKGEGDNSFPSQNEGGDGFIDIALPRTDFSCGTGIHRDFRVKYNPHLPIERDLERRDFTINAMAWDLVAKKFIDPYGGLNDLKTKMIRTVGAPKDRFSEDYSRLLRAIRFAQELKFKIESKSWSAIKQLIGHINDLAPDGERKVPYEVIAGEFLKSFSAAPRETIEMYLECGVLKKLMPEIYKMKNCQQPKEFHSEGDVLTHTLLALDQIETGLFKKYFPAPVALTTKVAILLHDLGKPKTKKKVSGKTVFYNHDKVGAEMAKKFLERLKMSAPPGIGINIEEAVWLIKNHLLFFYSPPEAMRKTTLEKYLFHKQFSGRAHLEVFLADALATKPAKGKAELSRFRKACEIWKSLQEKPEVPPPPLLDGYEVMKILKIESGPKVGEILERLREEQLNQKIKNKKEAREFIKKMPPEGDTVKEAMI